MNHQQQQHQNTIQQQQQQSTTHQTLYDDNQYFNDIQNKSQQQQQQQQYNRNSDNFYQNDFSNNFIEKNQFEQEYHDSMFEYEIDGGGRHSVNSVDDQELQDISGNADMSERNVDGRSMTEAKVEEVKEVVDYQIKDKVGGVGQLNEEKQGEIKEDIVVAGQGMQSVVDQKVDKKQTITFDRQIVQIKDEKLQVQKSGDDENNAQNCQLQQPDKKQQIDQQNNKKQEQNNQKILFTPEKSPIISQKQQQQKTQEKSRISFVKQNIISLKQTSIRDWFKLSQKKQTHVREQASKLPEYSKSDSKQVEYKRQMQRQMFEVQSSLNRHSKNTKNLQSERQKNIQKVNKTHLVSTNMNKLFVMSKQGADYEMGRDELRMLLKISFEKKKENYNMLRDWDKKRAESMGLHRNMIEMVQNEVDKRIKSSLENFEIYHNFFREKLKQQEKFINSSVINTKYALQNNSVSKNIYINCSVILNSLSDQNQGKCKKIHDFITLIRINILKELVEEHLHQSQKELLKVREKISSLKNQLKKYNTETEEKSVSLAGLFSESANNVSIKSPSDFYSVQLQFLRCAGQQIMIQKKLGESCLQYYHTALNEQQKRSKIIKQALLTYSKGLKQTYNLQLQDVELQQLSKEEEQKLIEEFYSLEDMFDERSRIFFKQRFNLPNQQDLTIREFSRYIQSFEFENFNSRMLLLKEFYARYYGPGVKQPSSSSTSSFSQSHTKPPAQREQLCYMVITVDFYIHLFLSYDKPAQILNTKPDISLKINSKQMQIRSQKEEFIDIVKKEQKRASMISYFWEGKNQKTYRLRFNTKDAKQEFCDYVNKLMY